MARQGQKSGAKSPSRGEQQRECILNQAIKLASDEGLEALTIGRLAALREMSKSGLFAHFGSKQKLQLATIEKAHEMFDQAVLQPIEGSAAGIARLWDLCDAWLKHLQDGVFSSGYFFTGAFFEYGQRKGHIAGRLQEEAQSWMKLIQDAAQQAQSRKELRKEPSKESMAFELNAMLIGAYWSHLVGAWDAYSEARLTILGRLRNWASDKIPSRALRNLSTWRRYLKSRSKRGPEE